MNAKRLKHSAWLVASALLVTGCGLMPTMDDVAPDNAQKYRRADTMPALEVPPDLSTSRINDEIVGSVSSAATFSEYEEARNNPLAARYNVIADEKPALAGSDTNRHLVVPGDRAITWGRVEDFWVAQGLDIRRQDDRIGLMETVADTEGYAFRVRMERGDVERSARLFVIGRDDASRDNQKDEAMLRQLAAYLGALHQEEQTRPVVERPQAPSAVQATSVANVTLFDEPNGYQALVVEQDFSVVWDRVGRVLDSRGFQVEDRDRSRGFYFVRYIDPFLEAERDEPGFFGRMAFWRSAPERTPEEYYYIKLTSDGGLTRITVLDSEEVRSSTETASRLLGLIQEQLTP